MIYNPRPTRAKYNRPSKSGGEFNYPSSPENPKRTKLIDAMHKSDEAVSKAGKRLAKINRIPGGKLADAVYKKYKHLTRP